MALNTAVVGSGVVSGIHLAGLEKLPSTNLVAVCDLDEERVENKARAHNINAYVDMETMLDRESLDWIHLCTPVQTHLELAKLAIEFGVPVQIEKPVTETVEEVEELERFANRHDVAVSVVHNHDFEMVLQKARTKIERGDIGTVRSVDLLYAGETWPDDVNRGEWAFDLPGGEFEEGLPHPIYILLNIGGYPESTRAINANIDRHRQYERGFSYDGVQFQYRTGEGVLCSGTVVASSIPHKVMQVHGSEASLQIDLVSQTVTTLDRGYEDSSIARGLLNVDHSVDRFIGTVTNLYGLLKRSQSDSWEAERDVIPHYYQFDKEAEALLQDDSLPVPLEEAKWTIQIMEEIRPDSEATTEAGAVEEFPQKGVDRQDD